MNLKKHGYYFLLSIASAILLTASFPPFNLFFLSFSGFVPLFFLERMIRDNHDHSGIFYFHVSISLFFWNAFTTFWIWNASPEGAIAAFVINMLMMSLPFIFFHKMQLKGNERNALWAFIFAWISFEYWHLNWQLAWPWLTLGNIFAVAPATAQWYEYTGVFGGSIWILYLNKKIFEYLKKIKDRSRFLNFSKAFNLLFFGIFAPILASYFIQFNYSAKNNLEKKEEINVLVVQPNIDPYTDKFNGMAPIEQTKKMLHIAEEKMDSTVQLVVFPETALQGNIDEDHFEMNESIQLVRNFIRKYSGISILTGADTYKIYPDEKLKTTTSRKVENVGYYDAFNTALLIDSTLNIQVYHKVKLVPGVEKMPYPEIFGFLEKLALKLGGTNGSLGSSTTPINFVINNSIKIAPVICYESIFGEYVSEYIHQNANLICIITNDGWWGNTPGFSQHFNYASLRAIESRRYVARAANTGISGFYNSEGNMLMRSDWWKEAALKTKISLNQHETFYVRHGDYIAYFSLLALVVILINYFKSKRNSF